jgi:hypothetical protein
VANRGALARTGIEEDGLGFWVELSTGNVQDSRKAATAKIDRFRAFIKRLDEGI